MQAVGVLRRFASHDQVFHEFALAVCIQALFPPSQSVAVSIEAGDDIVESVPVDIVGEHISAAWAEGGWGEFPESFLIRAWVFEPACIHEDILAIVSIDIPDAEGVSESFVGDCIGDAGKSPRIKAVFCGGCVSEHSGAGADEFGLAIAGDVRESWRFVRDPVEDLVFGPVAVGVESFSWVLVDESGGAWEADGEDIVVPVGVKVMDPCEEVVRVGVHGLRFGGVDFGGLFEVRSSEPVGAVDHIHVGISVEITNGGTFAEIR